MWMLIIAKIILWWHFPNIDISTTLFEIRFWLIHKIRSMQEEELFTIWVGLVISCFYHANDIRESISESIELVMSLLHHFEHLALKSTVMT